MDKTDFPQADLSEFLENTAKRFCPQCGKAIRQPRYGRTKKFCSDRCRWAWWNTHPSPENWKKVEKRICPVCGRVFLARLQEGRARTYCSRACANKGKRKGGVKDDYESERG